MRLVLSIPNQLYILFAISVIAAIIALASALVAAALLAFVWWLNNWNLLGFRF